MFAVSTENRQWFWWDCRRRHSTDDNFDKSV